MWQSPEDILQHVLEQAEKSHISVISDSEVKRQIEYICECVSNRAGVRLLMACLLAKIENPKIDPRKPYTEIGTSDSFSGRTYDEKYLTSFINKNNLPCNPTTAFLTPTLRNIHQPLTTNTELIGRPRELYIETLKLLEHLATNKVDATLTFIEVIRLLINIRDKKSARISTLVDNIKINKTTLLLSTEAILNLVEQHLACKNSSRLPVLIVAAAYKAAGEKLGEELLPLNSHTAADLQTGSMGDIEICLIKNGHRVTVYEMKTTCVTMNDIDVALKKIERSMIRPQNYLFITTAPIDPVLIDYTKTLYEKTGGIEVAVLDCLSFLRHFLHIFHRFRMDFIDNYQQLILAESDSSVNQILKETFLTLRQAAQSS